jgi:nucleoside-diphosphate-sugar epimerase
VVVIGGAGTRAHEIVDQRIARPGIAGHRIAAVDIGDVGDAAEIKHRDRMRTGEIARQRLVKHRHDRGALPAACNINLAEIIGHRQTQAPGQSRAMTDLDGQPRLRLVEHGLAVKADDVAAGPVDPFV